MHIGTTNLHGRAVHHKTKMKKYHYTSYIYRTINQLQQVRLQYVSKGSLSTKSHFTLEGIRGYVCACLCPLLINSHTNECLRVQNRCN